MALNTTVAILKKVGWQFYVVNPHEHMFEKVEDLPKPSYVNQVSFVYSTVNFIIFLNTIFSDLPTVFTSHPLYITNILAVTSYFCWDDHFGNHDSTLPWKRGNTDK